MQEYKINAVPYVHVALETWRDPFQGITHLHSETGLLISGAVDDLWVTPKGSLIVVDYKATSKPGQIVTLDDSSWSEQYARQIGVYQWLLKQNDFEVEKTGYFVYANGDASRDTFSNALNFETTVVPCHGETDWIPEVLERIKTCLTANTYPESGQSCEYCPYREACGKKLQSMHHEKNK
jgi:hypothetical protein